MRRCVYPRRGRGLTEGVTACAVGAGAHIDGASRCPMRPPLSLRADGVTRCNAPLAHTDGWRTMWMRNMMGGGEVAYLRHAEVGVEENPGTLRCALRTGLRKSAVALRRESANRPCVDVYNRSSAVVARALVSRGRQANPVLTY